MGDTSTAFFVRIINHNHAHHARRILDFEVGGSVRDSIPVRMVHQAFLVLWSIEFDNGDMKGAANNLIASVTVPKPHDYDGLIPDMSLARLLLNKGERVAVLEFLERSLVVVLLGDELLV